MPTSEIQTSQQIQDLFDRIAPDYDHLNQMLSLGLHQVWKGMAVRWAKPPQGSRVLDLCCGSGDLALHLARRVGRQGHVYGLDFSERLLAVAQQRSHLLLPSYQFTWQLGDALAIPFPDDHFAAVTMGYGLRNVIDIPQALREIYRILQPGSWATILDFHRSELSWARQFQELYLAQVVVPAATKAGLQTEYAYISPSLDRFPTGDQQLQLAKAAGFSRRYFYPLALGLMGVLVVQKI